MNQELSRVKLRHRWRKIIQGFKIGWANGLHFR